MLNYLPKFFTSKAIYLYCTVLFICNIYFQSRVLPIVWWFFGISEVFGFFYFSNLLSRQWSNIKSKAFQQKVFYTALFIRLFWVLISYFFYIQMTGQPFEFHTGDAFGYHNEALWLKSLIEKGNLEPYFHNLKGRYSDMGYVYYLGWQYWLTNGSIFIARILKVLMGAYSCVLIYKLTFRNFGESVSRLAAVFCVLMPNLIYYTGLHTKEVEMVFLTVLFVERADYVLRSKKYNFFSIVIPLLLGITLFLFRTVLGVTAFFSFFSSLLFSTNKVLGMGKRTLLLIWTVLALSYFIGGKISTEVEGVWNTKSLNQQKSLEFRASRDNGNKLAKYASGAIFVPLIFVIPFPTLINTPFQENQQLIHGGNYVKNILAFFILFAIFWVIKNNQWRENVFIGSFTIGYLLIIAMSAFAQSERFHQPALPFLLIMAAFGVTKITNNEKKYFMWYIGVIFIAIVIWSWYKLAGRGLA